MHGKKLTPVSTSLQQVNERATDAQSKLEDLTTRMSAIEARSKGFEQIETKIRSLGDSVTQAEETADRLLAPDGELKKHKQAVEQLSSQAIQTTAALDALKKEQTTLRQLREELQQAQNHVKESADETASITGDFDKLRGMASQLQGEHGQINDAAFDPGGRCGDDRGGEGRLA